MRSDHRGPDSRSGTATSSGVVPAGVMAGDAYQGPFNIISKIASPESARFDSVYLQ